jgi:hypothetical protein
MKHRIGEIAAKILVVGVLGLTTFLIFHFAPWKDNSGKRVIFLTAVARNGVWTEEKVDGTNYWTKDFKQAVIILKNGEEAIFRFTSMDVTHSFYAPELNIGPVDVWPGKIYDIPFKASKTGSFRYYCTKVCGKNHFYMQGKIIVIDAKSKITKSQIVKMQTDSIIVGNMTMQEPQMVAANIIERGENLFKLKNCITCHGANGIGGILNANYVLKSVPPLNTLAVKLKIPDKETADSIIALLDKNIDFEALEEDPPFPTFSRFTAQYATIKKKILEGAELVQKADSTGPMPPLTMPAWENYLTKEEINALIAYLINLNNWDEN